MLTPEQIRKDILAFQGEFPSGNSTVLIGSSTQAVHKGTVERNATLDDEGMTDGYLFSVWIDPTKFSSETIKPKKTKVTVDTIEYLLLDKSDASGGAFVRLDLKNKGR